MTLSDSVALEMAVVGQGVSLLADGEKSGF